MRISGVSYVGRKSHKTRNFFGTIFILILITILAIAILSLYFAWTLANPPRKEISPFTSNIVPEYSEISFKDIKESLTLSGWYFQARNSDKTVIFSHSYAKNRLQYDEKTIELVKGFIDMQYNVLLFDYRASGLSKGNTSSVAIHEKDDLLGAVKYAKSKGSNRVYIMGFSSGAAVALMAAAENKKQIDGIIADSPYTYADDYITYLTKMPHVYMGKAIHLALGLISRSFSGITDPYDLLMNVTPVPVLIIHGSNDPDMPVSGSRKLYNTYLSMNKNSTVMMWEPESNSHCKSFMENPAQYVQKIAEFMKSIG